MRSTPLRFEYCSRAAARPTWAGAVRDKDIPRSCRYALVYEGSREVGCVVWSGKRRARIQWLTVHREFRGRNLQRSIREAVGRACARAAGGRCTLYTYCNSWNLASMRNIVRSGGLPCKTTVDKDESTFIHFSQEFTV